MGAGAQAGELGAFSDLFDRYYDVVFRYVLFRMNDRTLAEDLTQETFLRALRRISSVTYQGRDIGAWFVTIARNLIFDHVKSSRYRLEGAVKALQHRAVRRRHPRRRRQPVGHPAVHPWSCATSRSSTGRPGRAPSRDGDSTLTTRQ